MAPERVRALYDFDPEGSAELGFREGDVITLIPLDNEDGEWLYGSLGDKEGAFPLAYVEPCDDDDYYDDDEFDEDLPPGWAAARDTTSGMIYYFNEAGESTWERPEVPARQATQQLAQTNSKQQALQGMGKSARKLVEGGEQRPMAVATMSRGRTVKTMEVTDEMLPEALDTGGGDGGRSSLGASRMGLGIGGSSGGKPAAVKRGATQRVPLRAVPGMRETHESDRIEPPDLKTARKQMAMERSGTHKPSAMRNTLQKSGSVRAPVSNQMTQGYGDDPFEVLSDDEEDNVKRLRESVRTKRDAIKNAEAAATLRTSRLPPPSGGEKKMMAKGATSSNLRSSRSSVRRQGPTEEEIEEFRRNHAARKIQWAYRDSANQSPGVSKGGGSGARGAGGAKKQKRGMPGRSMTMNASKRGGMASSSSRAGPSEEEIEALRQDLAAKRIQRAYRNSPVSSRASTAVQASPPPLARQASSMRAAAPRPGPISTQQRQATERQGLAPMQTSKRLMGGTMDEGGGGPGRKTSNGGGPEVTRRRSSEKTRTQGLTGADGSRTVTAGLEEEIEIKLYSPRNAKLENLRKLQERKDRIRRRIQAASTIQRAFRRWKRKARLNLTLRRRSQSGNQLAPPPARQPTSKQLHQSMNGTGQRPAPPPMGGTLQRTSQMSVAVPPRSSADGEAMFEALKTPKNYVHGSTGGYQRQPQQGGTGGGRDAAAAGRTSNKRAAGGGLSLDDALVRLISDLIEEKITRELERRGLSRRPSAASSSSTSSSRSSASSSAGLPAGSMRRSAGDRQRADSILDVDDPPDPPLPQARTNPTAAKHQPKPKPAAASPRMDDEQQRQRFFSQRSGVPGGQGSGSSTTLQELERRNQEVRERVAAKDRQLKQALSPTRYYKDCRSNVHAPSDLDTASLGREPPLSSLALEHVYGYNGDLLRYGSHERFSTNVIWLTTGEVAFPASTVVVLFDSEHNQQRFFLGHDDDVMALARHPTLDICASGQAGPRPSKVCVYDASAKRVEPLQSFVPSPTARGVSCVDFSPDGELLVVVADEDAYQKVSVWDWRKANFLTQLHSKVSRFNGIRFNPLCFTGPKRARLETNVVYTLVSGATRQIKFWTLTLEPYKAGANTAVASRDRDGRYILRRQGSSKGFVYRLEANGGTLKRGMEAQDTLCVCFVREEQEGARAGKKRRRAGGARAYTLAGTDKGAIHVWAQLESVDSEEEQQEDDGAADDEEGGGALRGWLAKGRLVSVMPDAHEGAVTSLCYSKEQHVVVSCGKDGLVNCWVPNQSHGRDGGKSSSAPLQMVRSLQLLGSIPGIGAARSIAWSPETSCWVVGTTGCAICLLRSKAQGTSGKAGGSKRAQRSSEHDGGLQVVPLIRGHTGHVRALADHPTMPAFATAGADKTLRIWDSSAKKLLYINRLWDRGTALAFHPQGHLLAVGTEEGEVIVLECTTTSRRKPNKASQQLPPEQVGLKLDEWRVVARRGVLLASAHPDGLGTSASRGKGSSTQLPGLDESEGGGKAHKRAGSSKGDICALRWSPDGKILAAACRDKLVHLFSVELQYKRLGTCRGHTTAVIRLDFSRDGSVLQSNDMGREVLFWDVETAKQLRNPSTTRELRFATWTCIYGWAVQGIWGHNAAADGPSAGKESSALPVVCRSRDEAVLAVGDRRRLRLLRYPCLKGAASKMVAAHTSTITAVSFLHNDTRLVTTGGADLCVFQWRHSGGGVGDGSMSPTPSAAPSPTSRSQRKPLLSLEASASYHPATSKPGVLSPTAASASKARQASKPHAA